MSGSFTVGALAVAAREANAVGALRLTLLPRRLEIELLRAGAFSDGYVPGGLTRFVRFSVPYSAVRGLVRRGRGVILSLDAGAATPFNRFFLTHFTDLPLEALASVHKRRLWAKAIAWALPVPLAAWLASQAPPDLVSGLLGRASAFALLTLAFGYVLRVGATWVETGSPLSTRLRDTLELRLAQRMGYEPRLIHETDPFDVPLESDTGWVEPRASAWAPVRELGSPELLLPELAPPAAVTSSVGLPAALPALAKESLPIEPVRPAAQARIALFSGQLRARVLTVAFAVGATMLALFGARWVADLEPTREAPPLVARAGIPAVEIPSDEAALAPTLPSCTCSRADSPLWKSGLPVLSLLTIPKPPADSIAPIKNRRGRFRYDFDVAVVNNAAEALKDVRVVLTFARRNERGERVGATDRGLFWEGLLGPAKSVKWGVKAPGTELRIDMDEKRLLGTVPAADADGFEKLLKAKQPSVRLHAAMMLAYLGDARAEKAARSLGELRGEAGETQARILRAARPLKTCDAKFEHGALEVCAFNGTASAVSGLRLAEVSPDGSGRSADLVEAIPANAGVRVSVPAFGGEAEELELLPSR